MAGSQSAPIFRPPGPLIDMKKIPWGTLPNGLTTSLYILANPNQMEIAVTDYGASIVSLKVPDRLGKVEDVVLGYDDVSGYVADTQYLGASVGRYANRIAHGKFILDNTLYSLSRNEGDTTLHGGFLGFNKRLWKAHIVHEGEDIVEFKYESADGEEGFPGNLTTTITFSLTVTNDLHIHYSATTDKATVSRKRYWVESSKGCICGP